MFYQDLGRYQNQIAAIQGDVVISYQSLADRVSEVKTQVIEHTGPSKQVVALVTTNSIQTLVAYLALLDTPHCTLLVAPDMPDDARHTLLKRFAPTLLINERGDFDQGYAPSGGEQAAITNCDAGLLLSTSGSSGKAKYVALSRENLQANTDSICAYLPIQPDDRTLCALPFHYSYGLSVVNTHISQGACCVLTDATPVSKAYWQILERNRITSFAGVPYTYELLNKLRFTRKTYPNLRYFTQAGGKLAPELVGAFHEYAMRHNLTFYVMYGQTEATARMAYLEPSKLALKPTSIGQAIPGGRFKLVLETGSEVDKANVEGELLYQGSNIMLGYVNHSSELNGLLTTSSPKWLATGDLGYKDEEGDLFITGRKSRFIKLVGKRLDLDQCEKALLEVGFKCICTGDDNKLVTGVLVDTDNQSAKQNQDHTKQSAEDFARISTFLHQHHGIHPGKHLLVPLSEIMLTPNGKVDYPRLMKLAERGAHD